MDMDLGSISQFEQAAHGRWAVLGTVFPDV